MNDDINDAGLPVNVKEALLLLASFEELKAIHFDRKSEGGTITFEFHFPDGVMQ